MSSKNIRNLSLRTSSAKQHRKYLGDPNDPHYVPKSPLIDRQKLSSHDEEELKHQCSLALANVPHSDDMMDDPFRYLSSQITAKAPSKPAKSDSRPKQPHPTAPRRQVVEETSLSSYSTATPSETSKRETIQSNTTTPMTTPGVSPEDTDKRFSESGKRSHTSHPSSLKAEVIPAKGNAVYTFLQEPFPNTRPQAVATRSLTHLPSLMRSKSKSRVQDSSMDPDRSIITNPDFNKSLPAIPKVMTTNPEASFAVEGVAKERSNGITRMLKTMRLSRTNTALEMPTQKSAGDLPRQFGRVQAANTTKRHKYTFSSIFNKKSTPADKRATVG